MNDYERLAQDLRYAIRRLDALDGVDPDIEEAVEQARDLLVQARTVAEARA